MSEPIRSYTSGQGGATRSFFEFARLLRRSWRVSQNIEAEVDDLMKMLHECEQLVARHANGKRIENCRVLEIGPGQLPRQLAYFALKNDAVGVDLDVIPRGFDIPGYARMWRQNGPKRVMKTVGRKVLRFDAQFAREMCRQMQIKRLPDPPVRQMDATKTDFAAGSFDFTYSFSVFEHLPDPSAVLREQARVLRPGGVAYNHLHLYTCDDGGHDLRIRKDRRDGMPYWPHLRPQHQAMVEAFAYINKIRINQWREIFSRELPGCAFAHDWDTGELPARLKELRAAGELADYSDEELLTHNFIMIWQKPA
jgi:SAM-dependent methyltransferase